jgi:hypothetical protein
MVMDIKKMHSGVRRGNGVDPDPNDRITSTATTSTIFLENKVTVIPEPPYHVYSSKEKWSVVVIIGVAGLFSGLSSNIYFPSLNAIANVKNHT